MIGLIIRMLHARQHFVINLMFVLLDNGFLIAVSRILALHAEIGYPIIAGIAIAVVIVAQFERARDLHHVANG
ncbi:hypothetical protein A2U01_0066336, partial [Trifolium medium]|nr:hypothetical protein [Trifolium medium]